MSPISSFYYAQLPAGPPAPTLFQHVGGGSNPTIGGTSQTGRKFKFTLPNASGVGNCYILGLTWNSGTANPTITDSNGNTWPAAPAVSADAGAGNLKSTIWVLPNVAAGVNTITITFSVVINNFQSCISEFYNVATASPSDGSSSSGASPVTGASLTCGSFTPTTNGDLLWAYFCSSKPIAAANPSIWTKGTNFTMLDGDIGWTGTQFGMPHASEYFVQGTAAAINPGITSTGDSTDTFNCLAIALKAAAAGTAPPAGIRIVRICHFSTRSFPGAANATYKLQCPATGNLRLITGTDPNTTINSVSDSDGNSFTHVTAIVNDNFWYKEGTSVNTDLTVTLTVAANTSTNQSWRFVDIAGAASVNALDVATNIIVSANGVSSVNNAPTISPTSATGGLMIAAVGIGQGPGTGFNAGAPAGAIYDLMTYVNCEFTGQFTTTTNLSVTSITNGNLAVNDVVSTQDNQADAIITVSAGGGTGNYTTTTAAGGTTASISMFAGEFDNDFSENADLMGHAKYGPGGGTFNWNWTLEKMTTNSIAGGCAAFKSA